MLVVLEDLLETVVLGTVVPVDDGVEKKDVGEAAL